jgi:2-phosphoglycolate phosphatase
MGREGLPLTPRTDDLTMMLSGPSPGRFRAVVFDLDGTLIDSYDAIAASVNHVRSFRRLPPMPSDEIRRHVGRGAEHLLRETVAIGSVTENVELYKEHHPTVMAALTRLLPDVKGTLEYLHAHGLELAVCSNKPVVFSRELLERLDLSRLLHTVIGPEDAPRPKPAPDMLEEVVRRLGLPANQVLYVGDMVIDVDTARSAGIAVWAVPTGSEDLDRLQQAKPDRLLHSFAELKELAV